MSPDGTSQQAARAAPPLADTADGRMPDFLVIGAGKAGTTSLFHALSRHPMVFPSPRKEPRFFCFDGPGAAPDGLRGFPLGYVRDPAAYRRLFAGARPGQLAAEASTWYLTCPGAAARIRAAAPDARLIAILREPVARAYSHWLHCRREGAEPLSFEAALAAEPQRRAEGWAPHWHYLGQSDYAAGLAAYRAAFPADRLLVLLYDDLVRDLPAALRRVCVFLGIAPSSTPPAAPRLNTGGVPRSVALQRRIERRRWRAAPGGEPRSTARLRLLELASRLNTRPAPPMAEATRLALRDRFAPMVRQLEDMLDRDLSAWRG